MGATRTLRCISRSCLMLRACAQLVHGVPGAHIPLSASGGPPLSPPCSQGYSCPYPSSRTLSSTLAKHSNPRRCASPRRSAVSGSGPLCGTGKSPRWPTLSEQSRTRGMGTLPCCSTARSTAHRAARAGEEGSGGQRRRAGGAGEEGRGGQAGEEGRQGVPLPPPRWNAWLTAYDVTLPPQHVWPTQQALKPQIPLPVFTRATTHLPARNRKQQPPLPMLGRRLSRHQTCTALASRCLRPTITQRNGLRKP